MKRASLLRLFSWLVVVALAATLTPPAVSSNANVIQREAAAPLPELVSSAGADAVRLATGASLHTALLGASQVVTASAALADTLAVTDDVLFPDAPLAPAPALTATWMLTTPLAVETTGGSDFVASQSEPGEAMPLSPPPMTGYKPPLSLELLLDVQPNRAKPGDVLSYRLVASHTGREPLANITLSVPMPRGLVYVPDSATGFSYSPSDHRLTWQVDALQPGETLTGGFQLRVNGLVMGELATVQARAASPLADGASLGSAVAEIVPPAAPSGLCTTPWIG